VGVVFEDLDGNGVQDVFAGEMGLAGWTVDLYWNGQVIASAVTQSDGSYVFQGLAAFTSYSACIQIQAGYTETKPVGAMANGCGGTGYTFSFNNNFVSQFPGDFGMKLP